jgi:hypothetical protein
MLTKDSLLVVLSICLLSAVIASKGSDLLHNNRPPVNERKFISSAIENVINQTSSKMVDPYLAFLFVNCYPNTLDTTVEYSVDKITNRPDTFVITGDIPAMWLRDSSAQVLPYVPYAKQDQHLQSMLRGVINRQVKSVNIDVYANAFNFNTSTAGHLDDHRIPPMTPKLWEGKYELDSLAWMLRLSAEYYEVTHDSSMCADPEWKKALWRIIEATKYQQKSTVEMSQNDEYFYSFSRLAWDQSETLQNGIGAPALHCGLSRSPFRPSDDSHRLPFPVAANAMMAVSMKRIYEVLNKDSSCRDEKLVNATRDLAREIERAVWEHGVVHHPHLGRIFAFEVDGYGSFYAVDDANIPSVLSLPYLGFVTPKDETYARTRKFLFSERNPWYFKGTKGRGIGSQHTGVDYIWPLAIVMQATTSENDDEIKECLELLKSTDNGTGFMHESFYKNDPSKFTRTWFAWANAQFGHLILKLAKERPYLIFGNQPASV